MSIRRLSYKDADGQARTRDKWYGFFTDHAGVQRKLPLHGDKGASLEADRKIRRLVDRRAADQTLDGELVRWLESTDPLIREKLVEFGVISATLLTASRPLSNHIDDWNAALLAKGNDPRDVEQKTGRVRSIFTGAGLLYWSEVTASKVQAHLTKLREGEGGIGPQTFNHYVQHVKQFGNWMVRDGRASVSPVQYISKLNAKTDCRHCRRALGIEELRRVVLVTAVEPERFGMTGQERALLYRLTVGTGLRANEIRGLTRGNFVLKGDSPVVTIAAAYSKHRRNDVQPLPRELVADLEQYLANKLPTAPAFNMPNRTEVSRMWRADLDAAKKAWVAEETSIESKLEREKAPFLAYKTDAGEYADYHALRHTFITNLVAGNVHPKTAQTLARHGTIGLTMDRYTHVRMEDVDAALDVLPSLINSADEVAKATGTDDAKSLRVSSHVSNGGGTLRSLGHPSALKGSDSIMGGNPRNTQKLTDFPGPNTVSSTPGGVAEWSNAPVLKTGSDSPSLPLHPSENTPVTTKGDEGIDRRVSSHVSIALKKYPELVRLIEVWPDLPEALRVGILAIVERTGN